MLWCKIDGLRPRAEGRIIESREEEVRMLISAGQTALVVIDVQERLAPAIAGLDDVIGGIQTLLKAAGQLDVPILASEQYPKGLGTTIGPVAALLPPGSIVEKTHFSCAEEPRFFDRLAETGRRQVVMCGIESHVCVLQTALGLSERGMACFVVADAVGSRREENKDLALQRLRQAGVAIVTVEMVLFEWMHRAGTEVFRTVSKLIR